MAVLRLIYNCEQCDYLQIKKIGETLAFSQSFWTWFVSIEKLKVNVNTLTITSDSNLSNFTDIPSKVVAFAVHIPEISLLTKFTDIFGILNELNGMSCSISGKKTSNYLPKLWPMQQKKLLKMFTNLSFSYFLFFVMFVCFPCLVYVLLISARILVPLITLSFSVTVYLSDSRYDVKQFFGLDGINSFSLFHMSFGFALVWSIASSTKVGFASLISETTMLRANLNNAQW